MKKLILLILTAVSSLTAMGQEYAACVNGYWTDWTSSWSINFRSTADGFILCSDSNKPWDYSFKCSYDTRSGYKEDKWTVYSGTVEYYTSSDYPSISSSLSRSPYPFVHPGVWSDARKHTVNAQIKIRKNLLGKTYNIYFDNVGFAVSLSNL